MDPYQNSGYKTDRARGQARAFKTPSPVAGFVSPPMYPAVPFPVPGLAPQPTYYPLPPGEGVTWAAKGAPSPYGPNNPIDFLRPPAPPGGGGGGAGAGAVGGSALPFAIALAGGAAAALIAYEGYEALKDIKRFKRDARYPFYDDAQWVRSSYVIGFSQAEDDATKRHLQDVLDRYQMSHSPYPLGHVEIAPYPNWQSGVYPPTGWWSKYFCYIQCQSPPAAFVRYANVYGGLVTGSGPGPCDGTVGGFCNQNLIGNDVSPDVFAWGNAIECFAKTAPGNLTGKAFATYWPLVDPAPLAPKWRFGHGAVLTPVPQPDEEVKVGAWPGGEPSLDEQRVGVELPLGHPGMGYYVPMIANYPFTIVDVAPGSPPVTVPDVHIIPGVGAVVVPPGGPPEYGNADAERERKPAGKIRAAGHVFVSVATEWNDFLEAMHKGLPKKYRTKKSWGLVPDPGRILGDIWEHWDEWDADLALEYFVNNQIEDHLLGKYYFGAISRRARKAGLGKFSPFGVRGTGKLAGAVPLPEVHFANGTHSISVGDFEVNLVQEN